MGMRAFTSVARQFSWHEARRSVVGHLLIVDLRREVVAQVAHILDRILDHCKPSSVRED